MSPPSVFAALTVIGALAGGMCGANPVFASEHALAAEELLIALSKGRETEVGFEEASFSKLLTAPLVTRGVLRFSPPSRLERHTLAPYEERQVVDGDRIIHERPAEGVRHVLSLTDHPELRAFVEAFRGVLTGDLATLRRSYELTVEGTRREWSMDLRPHDPALGQLVALIRFYGENDGVTGIEVRAVDGDRSVMVMKEMPQ